MSKTSDFANPLQAELDRIEKTLAESESFQTVVQSLASPFYDTLGNVVLDSLAPYSYEDLMEGLEPLESGPTRVELSNPVEFVWPEPPSWWSRHWVGVVGLMIMLATLVVAMIALVRTTG